MFVYLKIARVKTLYFFLMKREREENVLEFLPSVKPEQATYSGLPKWIEFPVIVDPEFTKTNENEIRNPKYRLSRHCLDILSKKEITHLFPVQQEMIPRLYTSRFRTNSFGNDILVSASTGSGKTLAYVLPVIEALLNRVVCKLQCLVVLPTKDLAVQVHKEFDSFCVGTDLKSSLAVGGHSTQFEHVDILVFSSN